MTGLAIRFTAGRFHATPWARHVNEGAPEWPPSPWRLLRSLIATWKRKLDGDVSMHQMGDLLAQLVEPPEFVLPAASAGHTRHYMPWFKKGPDDRTMVFDAFVALPKDVETCALWPSRSLTPEQTSLLTLLAEHLQFLGRAESWCSARVLSDGEVEALQPRINSRPVNGTRLPGAELVRVLCPDPDRALANDAFTVSRERKRKGKIEMMPEKVVTYDPDWHLAAETLWLHDQRWSDPPGSRWVTYMRPSDSFRVSPIRQKPKSERPRPQVARFALDSTVLPLATDTLPVAEAARRNLMGLFGRINPAPDGAKGRSAILSGKDAEGQVLTGHGHAYYLPTDEDGDGRLDHFTVVSDEGFGTGELRALDRFLQIKTAEREISGHTLRVVLLGLGRLDDYQAGPVGRATIWESATPFIVTRHLKKRGQKRDAPALWNDQETFIVTVLCEELARLIQRRPELAGISPTSVGIEPMHESGVFRCGARRWRPIEFRRFRQKRSDDGGRRMAGTFRLVFPEAVRGPIALGHSAHFGMGLFYPVLGTTP